VEVTIANCCGSSFSIAESKKGRAEVKKNTKFFKNLTKETMIISIAELVHIIGKPNSEEKRSMSFEDTIRRGPTLKELQREEISIP